jgi:hypothetical protein
MLIATFISTFPICAAKISANRPIVLAVSKLPHVAQIP